MVYYLNEDFLKDVPYVINKFCNQKFDDNHILLTTDHGSWVLLSKEEYELLLKKRVEEDSHLFEVLEDKGIIITEKNQNSLVEGYGEKFNYLFNGISLHIIAPTLRCNQNCVYCQANSKDLKCKNYDMDENTSKDVIDFIFQTPSKFINVEFQGGEPLVIFPILQYIIEYVKQKNNSTNCNEKGWFSGCKNVSFTIVTNLTLMDNDILNYFLKNRVRISTSLDGPKEIHNKNRPFRSGKGSYDDVVYWIDVVKEKYPNLSALPTITKFSLNHVKEISDEYIKYNFSHTRMRELNIAGMTIKSLDEIGYKPEDFLKFWKEYLKYVIALNKKGIKFWDETTSFIITRILCKKSRLNACLNSPCGVGTIQSAYNHKGDVYTCDEARSDETFKIGNVKENNYKEVFTSESIANFIRLSSCTSFLCDDCVWHAYCSPCLISAYGENRSLVPKFPNFTCKIRGGQIEEIFKNIIFSKDRDILLGLSKLSRLDKLLKEKSN